MLPEMKTLLIREISDWKEAGKKLLEYAGNKKVFVFSGEIGAGKTTFIQALCQLLGVQESVTSPTFSLVNEYIGGEPSQAEPVYHLDLYRLKNMGEALDIGIEELLYSGRFCFIEWPELIGPLLEEEEVVRIQIQIVEDSTRKVVFL
jgi:tRNA threonylcarbamoyladenosine biosynthesis protein TsaE